ncbi:hypothetical protein K435DRAFT_962543 [Dendrothele bispora CBS 962.96]|uniref:DUF6534 domain-containing protein n=1 Tax=Dendrothele bispora (strain CBS 962.96) TaxID=1314807 RepID=A0A4S8MKR5_DENBC|nr:hypothetical protein K435DRAFT_962543 [Dendrothele bispora CBS 962.96]
MPSPAIVAVGPIFIGWMFNVFLLGILTVQGYVYLKTYRKDRLWMKIFVVALLTANFLNTGFIAAYLYKTLVIDFGDVAQVLQLHWLIATDPILTGSVALCVELFFSWRIKVLTGSTVAAGVILVPTAAGFVGSMITASLIKPNVQFIHIIKFKVSVIVWLMGGVLSDLMITTILVAYLHSNKRGFKASDELIDRIIRSTVQTGLLTSVVASLDLVSYLIFPTEGFHFIFNMPLIKLYSVTLMSSLNSRQGWSYGSTESGGGQTSGTASNPSIFNKNYMRSTQVVVHVEHEMDSMTMEGPEDLERGGTKEIETETICQKDMSVFKGSSATLAAVAV